MDSIEVIATAISICGLIVAMIAGWMGVSGKLDRSEDRQRQEHNELLGAVRELREEQSSTSKQNAEQHAKFNDILLETATILKEAAKK